MFQAFMMGFAVFAASVARAAAVHADRSAEEHERAARRARALAFEVRAIARMLALDPNDPSAPREADDEHGAIEPDTVTFSAPEPPAAKSDTDDTDD